MTVFGVLAFHSNVKTKAPQNDPCSKPHREATFVPKDTTDRVWARGDMCSSRMIDRLTPVFGDEALSPSPREKCRAHQVEIQLTHRLQLALAKLPHPRYRSKAEHLFFFAGEQRFGSVTAERRRHGRLLAISEINPPGPKGGWGSWKFIARSSCQTTKCSMGTYKE